MSHECLRVTSRNGGNRVRQGGHMTSYEIWHHGVEVGDVSGGRCGLRRLVEPSGGLEVGGTRAAWRQKLAQEVLRLVAGFPSS